MEEVKGRAPEVLQRNCCCFRYADDTQVKIKTQEVQAFAEHINSVDINTKFTRESCQGQQLGLFVLHPVKRTGATTPEYTGNPHKQTAPLERKAVRTLQTRSCIPGIHSMHVDTLTGPL